MQMLYFFLHLIWMILWNEGGNCKVLQCFSGSVDEEAEVEAIRNMQDGHWLAVEMNRRIQAAVNSSREKGEEGK